MPRAPRQVDSNSLHPRSIQRLVWGGLAGLMLLILAAFAWKLSRARDSNPAQDLAALGPLPSFTLTNQHAQPVSLQTLLGRVWIADIIFTRCPGPCAVMTRRMRELQAALPEGWPVQLVSLTTDPDFDTPEVLRAYAHEHGADSNRWHFLTGPKAELRRMAVDGLKLAVLDVPAEERDSPEDLFIHSTLLVVVDQQGHLRHAFESLPRTDGESKEGAPELNPELAFQKTKTDLLEAVKRLLQEGH